MLGCYGTHRMKKQTILIVDDSPENIDVVVGALSKQYEVKAALNGKMALELAFETPPDLILLDIMMPEMDGYEVCKQLHASMNTAEIPIIFLTAKTDVSDVVKGLKYGAVDYLTKPFNIEELSARVDTHIALKCSKEAVVNLSNQQKELVHILCHDLVAPMGAVKNILQFSKRKNADFLFQKVDVLLDALDMGLEIVDSVRQMRALEEGKTVLELQKFNLKTMVQFSINMLQMKFSEKNIEPVIEIDPDISVLVDNTSFISSVLNNILTNAIKFSFTDSKIDIKAYSIHNNNVEVIVTDYGMGMPDIILNQLFEMSKTTSRLGTSGEVGTGFGMPLMKKFVSLYGGKIEVTSKEKSENETEHGTQSKLILKME